MSFGSFSYLSGVPKPASDDSAFLGFSTGDDDDAASVLGGGSRMNRRWGLGRMGRDTEGPAGALSAVPAPAAWVPFDGRPMEAAVPDCAGVAEIRASGEADEVRIC